MGFIQEGSITATNGASGSCNGGYPSGPTSPRAGYPGYGPPGYAYPPIAVPAYYYPPMVRTLAIWCCASQQATMVMRS